MPKLGSKLSPADQQKVNKGAPPVVFAVQPDSYVTIQSPAELKQWEEDVQNFYGVKSLSGGMVGTASESCSGGCSDDCDLA